MRRRTNSWPPLKDSRCDFRLIQSRKVGSDEAAALAKQLAADGHEPFLVFEVGSFVSSDSALESKRFADAEIGKGFVVRPVDHSTVR